MTDGGSPPTEIEAVALYRLRAILSDQVTLSGWIGEHASHSDVPRRLEQAKLTLARTDDDALHQSERREDPLTSMVREVVIEAADPGSIAMIVARTWRTPKTGD